VLPIFGCFFHRLRAHLTAPKTHSWKLGSTMKEAPVGA
jgi:hypothetical protein